MSKNDSNERNLNSSYAEVRDKNAVSKNRAAKSAAAKNKNSQNKNMDSDAEDCGRQNFRRKDCRKRQKICREGAAEEAVPSFICHTNPEGCITLVQAAICQMQKHGGFKRGVCVQIE